MERQPISREGYDKLLAEIKHLEDEELPKIAEKIATTIPVTIEVTHGVLKRGWIRLMKGGSSPSRDMAQKTRDCPSSITRITDDNPAMAPTFTNLRIHAPMPARSAAKAIGSGTSRSL